VLDKPANENLPHNWKTIFHRSTLKTEIEKMRTWHHGKIDEAFGYEREKVGRAIKVRECMQNKK